MSESQTGETIETRAGEQLDLQAVERYLRAHIAGLEVGPLEVRQFPVGASNLTYLLRLGEWEGVLRRPPFGPLPPRAHDMQREAGLLRQVAPVFPLAPRPYVFCDDPAVLGAPFYIMERKRGVVLDASFPPGVQPDAALCQRLSETVAETLAQIHAIDWQAAGLDAFGHPDGFLARQVKSWIERYSRAQTDEYAEIAPLTSWLGEHIPASPAPTLIHNDFKLNNMVLASDDLTRPTGVLDWEMATIGDPLFDLGVTLSYWSEPGDPDDLRATLPAVTDHPGFLSRDAFMQHYARVSGRDLSAMHFYLTFAYFKLAVIIQQIYVRWKRGQTDDPRFARYGEGVHALIRQAARMTNR